MSNSEYGEAISECMRYSTGRNGSIISPQRGRNDNQLAVNGSSGLSFSNPGTTQATWCPTIAVHLEMLTGRDKPAAWVMPPVKYPMATPM
jgi:hypothetical protein